MNPDPIFQTLLGYRAAAVLRAAIELDCFSAVAEGKRTAREIAASRGGTERSIRILLDAVAATGPGVLRKSGKGYALTPLARRCLVRTSPDFVGPLMVLYGHRAMWDAFWNLSAAVRAGRSVLKSNAHTPNQRFWEDFARATARDAVPKAKEMIRALGRVPSPCDVIDLGCGSGAYGATFARELPGARVTLFDQANVLRTAGKHIDAPVRYLAGDLFKTPFSGPYDVAIASHVFHHFDRKDCARLARKIAGALKPGGRLVIQEFVADEARARKPQPLLFAVTMLVWTRSGDAYTRRDYRKWLSDAGFGKIDHPPLATPGDLITASKA